MAEPKESDDEIVKLNSTPPEEDEHGAATRIGEDAYARLARGMLSSPEVPRPDEPPRSFSSLRPGAPPPVPTKPPPSSMSRVPPPASSKAPPAGSTAPPPVLPKLGDDDLEDASSEGGTLLMPQAAQAQLLGHGSQAPAAETPTKTGRSASNPFPFPPPPPISEPPPPRAIRADIVVAVGVFFVLIVAALIFLYFRELMKH